VVCAGRWLRTSGTIVCAGRLIGWSCLYDRRFVLHGALVVRYADLSVADISVGGEFAFSDHVDHSGGAT